MSTGLTQAIERDFGPSLPVADWVKAEEAGDGSVLRGKIVAALEQAYDQKETNVGAQVMRYIEKEVMLRTLDQHWREHLAAMDYMRQGIYLRSYAQKNPEAGIQARGIRVVLRHAGSHQIRYRDHGVEDSSAQPGGDRARRTRAPAAAWRARCRRSTPKRSRRSRRRIAQKRGLARSRRRRRQCHGNGAALVRPPPRPSCVRCPRSDATSPVPADRAASTSTATAHCRSERLSIELR